MAGILGFALGAALGHAREKHQQEHELKGKMADFLAKGVASGQIDASDPNVMKGISSVYGKEAEPLFMAMSEHHKAGMAAVKQAEGQQHADNTPEAIDAQMAALQEVADKFPEQQGLVDKHIGLLRDKRNSLTKQKDVEAAAAEHHQEFQARQQEWQQNQQRMEQTTQAMMQLRAQGMQDSKEARAASLEMRQQESVGRQQLTQITLGMKQAQDKAMVQQHAEAAIANLTTRAKAISTSPVDQAKTQLPAFNAQVKALKKQLTDSGMPEIADSLNPLKLGEEPGKWYGTNPAIVEDTGDASAPAPSADHEAARKKLGL